LSKVGSDGKTLRETGDGISNQPMIAHRAPEELVNPTPEPVLLDYLWQLFLKLHNSKPSGFAPSAISNTEILAFCQLRRIQLCNFELDAIAALDHLSLTEKGKS
jgi:hypothetical protein